MVELFTLNAPNKLLVEPPIDGNWVDSDVEFNTSVLMEKISDEVEADGEIFVEVAAYSDVNNGELASDTARERGWVISGLLRPVASFVPNLIPLNGPDFGRDCVHASNTFVVNLHFLLAWGHFESEISNDVDETGTVKRIGPFRFTEEEWDGLRNQAALGIDFGILDVYRPAYQTDVAAAKLARTLDGMMVKNGGEPPMAGDLLLALSIGIDATLLALKDESKKIDGVLDAAYAEHENTAERRDHLLSIYSDRLMENGNPRTVAQIRAHIQAKFGISLSAMSDLLDELAQAEHPIIPTEIAANEVLGEGGKLVVLARSKGTALVNGHLVEKLQEGLVNKNAASPTVGGGKPFIDGVFGDATSTALKKWLNGNGKPESTRVTNDDWSAITDTSPPSTFDRCAQVTSHFEGHGFDLSVKGGFGFKRNGKIVRDQGGLTWGYLGFTWTYLHVQKIIKMVEAVDASLLTTAFGANRASQIRGQLNVTDAGSARRWAEQNFQDAGTKHHSIRPEWQSGFLAFGQQGAVRQAQVDYARQMWDKCTSILTPLNIGEMRTLGLCFDVFINRGPGNLRKAISGFSAGTDEAQIRATIDKRTGAGLPFREARNRAFVNGKAKVNGAMIDLSYWGVIPFEDDDLDQSAIGASAPQPDADQSFEDYLKRFVKFNAHFTARDLLRRGGSAGANRNKPMPPNEKRYWQNAVPLAKALVKISEILGSDINIHSAYRNPRYNSRIGGARHSQHKLFKAADFSCPGKSIQECKNAAEKVIGSNGGIGRYNSFVHVDVRGNRARW